MSNLPNLSKRARKALDILGDGGFFRHALETTFHGREQFKTHLYDRNRQKVHGFGYQTRCELSDAGMLITRPGAKSTTWPTEYVLAKF